MKRLIAVTILILMTVGVQACGQNELPMPEGSAQVGILQAVTGFILDPLVTLALVFLGMALIIVQLVSFGPWRAAGIGGVLCMGAVIGSGVIAGVAAPLGLALLVLGLALMMVESKLLPGYGVSVVGGLVCLFLGLFWTLGGAPVASVLFALMSAIAFVVHLPTNNAWRRTGRRVESRTCRPYGSTEAGRTQVSRPGEASRTETPERRTTHTDQSDDQTLHGRNGQ